MVFLSELRDRRQVAERTMAFFFERPRNWMFQAGQYVDLLLDRPEHQTEAQALGLTIASAPDEELLMLVTRVREAGFKRTLATMPLGSQVKMAGPFGNFTLHPDATRPAILLAGGIGVAPFRSMVVQAAKEKLHHRIFLFYSNRRPEDAPFLDELQSLERDNPNYKCIATMTRMQDSHLPWHGERGRINAEMLSKYLDGAGNAVYYVAGAPAMVKGVAQILRAMGIDSDDIRVEEFTGY